MPMQYLCESSVAPPGDSILRTLHQFLDYITPYVAGARRYLVFTTKQVFGLLHFSGFVQCLVMVG